MAKIEIRETVTATVTPHVLWDALFDPLPLRDCLPNATVFERVGENTYRLEIDLSTPVISGSYGGTFHVAEHSAYEYFRLAASAKGPLGNVKAIADVNLTPVGTQTRAAIAIRADLSGVLGFVGPPAAGLVGRWMVDRFFECINSTLTRRAAAGNATKGCTGCGAKAAGAGAAGNDPEIRLANMPTGETVLPPESRDEPVDLFGAVPPTEESSKMGSEEPEATDPSPKPHNPK